MKRCASQAIVCLPHPQTLSYQLDDKKMLTKDTLRVIIWAKSVLKNNATNSIRPLHPLIEITEEKCTPYT
jgi:hypothetical protein